MFAAIYDRRRATSSDLVTIKERPMPQRRGGHVLLRVLACGVCRTDLHIVKADLPPLNVMGATEVVAMKNLIF